MSNSARFIIVDDTDPNITYLPGPWFLYRGENFNKGNSGIPWNSTSHGVNANAALAYNFTGTAIEAYGTFDRRSIGANGEIDPSWDCLVDSRPIPGMTVPINGDYENNQLLCGVSSLSDEWHTIEIQATVIDHSISFWFDGFHYIPSKSVPLDDASVIIDIADPEIHYGDGWSPITGGIQTVESGAVLNLDFVGVQLTWFGMALANESGTRDTEASYSIDSATAFPFLLPSASGPDDQLNQIIFQTGNLTPGKHHLEVTYPIATTPLILQYLVVQNATIPDPSTYASTISSSGIGPSGQPTPSPLANPMPKSKFPTATVAGGVVGAIVVIASLIILIFLRRRARKKQRMTPTQSDAQVVLFEDSEVRLPAREDRSFMELPPSYTTN